MTALPEYASVSQLLRARQPRNPVYCLHPGACTANARDLVQRFPGRVLYAVKANDHPEVIRNIAAGGVRHFDCASLDEIVLVHTVCPGARCYFMTPVRIRGAAARAQREFGVRHFLIDHHSGLQQLSDEIDLTAAVVFARMAVHHPSAMQDLSQRFGAPAEDVTALLKQIAATGAEPALAFNVGSNVLSPDAYRQAINASVAVLGELPFKIRLIDLGGGFPLTYPGFAVPPVTAFIDAIESAARLLPMAGNGEILTEPGRALAAVGMSAVVEVLLRKDRRLFLNDGMYGIFWELRFRGHKRFPVRCFRDGEPVTGENEWFSLFGPTCDSSDAMPGEVELPGDIRAGDHLEFDRIGAYSLSGRTRFNGFYSEDIVVIRDSRDHD